MALKFGSWWQKSRLRSWWEKIRSGLHWLWQKIQKPLIVATIIALVVGVLTLSVVVILSNGIGINGYTKTTTTTEVTATPPKIITATATPSKVTITEEYQPGKTLWDLLQLLGVLAIPVIVGFGAAWFTRTQQLRDQEHEKLQRERDQEAARIQHDRDQQLAEQRAESERKAAEQQAELEREITHDNQRETSLQAYIDKMSDLLLEKHLRESKPEDEVRTIARVRTLTVLPRLDPTRKGSVLPFLREAGLIYNGRDRSIINLYGASLVGANLQNIILQNVDLGGANLQRANLQDANLEGADMQVANLRGADLQGAILVGANLQKASLVGRSQPARSRPARSHPRSS